jgi:hypothetical protein
VTKFSNTINAGTTIISFLLAVAALIGIFYGVKWKTNAAAAQATIDLWKDNALGEKAKADTLALDKERLVANNAELRLTIADYAKIPTVDTLASSIDELTKTLTETMKGHLSVLEEIANGQKAIIEKMPDLFKD